MANQGAAVPLARVGSPQASATGQGVPLARTTAQAGPSRHQGAPLPPPPEKRTLSPKGKGKEEDSDSEDEEIPATIINNQINTVMARPLRVNTPYAYRGERDLLDAFLLQCNIYIGFSGEKLFPDGGRQGPVGHDILERSSPSMDASLHSGPLDLPS